MPLTDTIYDPYKMSQLYSNIKRKHPDLYLVMVEYSNPSLDFDVATHPITGVVETNRQFTDLAIEKLGFGEGDMVARYFTKYGEHDARTDDIIKFIEEYIDEHAELIRLKLL